MSTPRRLFGTDGIRGLANAEPMTPEIALRVGRAVAELCQRAGRRARVVIGRDTRLSGPMLESALAAGIAAAGADALLAGVLPTPGVALLTRTLPADAGVVVSASHNPFADNGIKLFGGDGFKLADALEDEVERGVRRDAANAARPTAAAIGTICRLDDAEERYATALREIVDGASPLSGLAVALDGANGAAYRVAPRVLAALGARVVTVGVEPDGVNINAGCGAVHPERLQAEVRAAQATVGIALDGDADRVILVDDRGEVVDGDEILAMLADDMLARGTLRQGTVVATVMSNLGLEIALRARGAQLVRANVGDRYVVEAMRRGGYNLGGEQSGPVVLHDHGPTRDGVAAARHVLRVVRERQRPLSELRRVMTKLPQALINVPVARRQELDDVPQVCQVIGDVRAALGARGRVLVRHSGTEPLVRVMVEGDDDARVRQYAEEIAGAIREALGT